LTPSGLGWIVRPWGRSALEILMTYKFEISKDKAGEFRVKFKAPNGEVMFATEGYSSKASAKNAILSMQKNGPGADTDDTTD
jgi:uncharacterized protein YegP (UPF0339 family)